MNHCAIQQNSFGGCEEILASAAGRSLEKKEAVICPKPRRVGLIHARPLRWHVSGLQQEDRDARAGNELLDIILSKGGSGSSADHSAEQVAWSPPFFSGSPPSRVSNPLIQDECFGDDKVCVISPPIPASPRKGGCVRASFGNNPAVRIEGFDCLDRDRRNCRIPALA